MDSKPYFLFLKCPTHFILFKTDNAVLQLFLINVISCKEKFKRTALPSDKEPSFFYSCVYLVSFQPTTRWCFHIGWWSSNPVIVSVFLYCIISLLHLLCSYSSEIDLCCFQFHVAVLLLTLAGLTFTAISVIRRCLCKDKLD